MVQGTVVRSRRQVFVKEEGSAGATSGAAAFFSFLAASRLILASISFFAMALVGAIEEEGAITEEKHVASS